MNAPLSNTNRQKETLRYRHRMASILPFGLVLLGMGWVHGAFAQDVHPAEQPAGNDEASCVAMATQHASITTTCRAIAMELIKQAHVYYLAGAQAFAQPYLERASRIAPGNEGVMLEQALVDDASGRPEQARRLYDALRGSPMEAAAAVPSAVNLAILGRLDEARKAFSILSGSADAYTAGYAQLWQLWLDARTWRGDAAALREKMAHATVGLRAGNAQQQALLNLYAGQGSVDAVFSAIEASTAEGSLQRRDARAEAAFFAGGYLQYVLHDERTAKQLYRRELPMASASVERPVILQSIAAQ